MKKTAESVVKASFRLLEPYQCRAPTTTLRRSILVSIHKGTSGQDTLNAFLLNAHPAAVDHPDFLISRFNSSLEVGLHD